MNTRIYNVRILTMEENRSIFQGEVWIEGDMVTYVNQFYHLAGQEPALTGLISDGDERFGVGSQVLNVCRFIKTFALCKFFS